MNSRRRTVAILAAVFSLALGGSGAVTAAPAPTPETTVTRVVIRTESVAAVYSNAAFGNVAASGIFAQAGSTVLVRFTAESACFGGSGWCSARILVDGAEAAPAVGTDFAFDSTNNNAETGSSWESHSMERAFTVTFTGFHNVTLQVAMVGAGVNQRLDDWTLSSWAIAA